MHQCCQLALACVKKETQQSMGLVNYLRSHSPMIYRVAASITDLIKSDKDVVRNWTAVLTECFEAIKKILQADLLLNYPNFEKGYIVLLHVMQVYVMHQQWCNEILCSWDSLDIRKKYFVVSVGVTNVSFNIAFDHTYCLLIRLILGSSINQYWCSVI